MNPAIEQDWSMVEGTLKLRDQVLDALSDADLAFNPGGSNLTFGGLLREAGEVEQSYIDSVKTFKQNFDYRNTEAGLDSSTASLKAWFQQLDADFKTAVAALSDEDLKKTIDRGYPFAVNVQLQIYVQALLIFLGKAVVYFKAMNKPVPETIAQWIG
jgi:hypothetical protein